MAISNNKDQSEINEIGDTIILEDKICEIDIKSILHVFKQKQQICKEEINSCLDACDQGRRPL